MTLEDLRAFVAAYQAKSMSEAARRLGCTQGAVAQHVRRLEQELGVELFLRQRRGVAPTEQGDVLYGAADSSLSVLQAAAQEITRSVKQRENTLRLSTSASIVQRFLRGYILELQRRRPDVVVAIDHAQTASARLEALRQGRADIALVPLTDGVSGFETRAYCDVELALLVHPEHPLGSRRRVEARELGSIRYIAQSHDSGTYRHLQRALREVGVTLCPVEVVEDPATANLLVELGRGQTFLPSGLARQLARTHRVKAVKVCSLPRMQMVWAARSFALVPQVATEFVELCAAP